MRGYNREGTVDNDELVAKVVEMRRDQAMVAALRAAINTMPFGASMLECAIVADTVLDRLEGNPEGLRALIEKWGDG